MKFRFVQSPGESDQRMDTTKKKLLLSIPFNFWSWFTHQLLHLRFFVPKDNFYQFCSLLFPKKNIFSPSHLCCLAHTINPAPYPTTMRPVQLTHQQTAGSSSHIPPAAGLSSRLLHHPHHPQPLFWLPKPSHCC